MVQSTMQLQKELQTIKNQQTKMLRSFKHQTDMLSQFIIKLSNSVAGLDPSLDKELSVLRGHLGGQANFALAEVSIKKIYELLKEDACQLKNQSQRMIKLLETAVSTLHHRVGISDQLKQDSLQYLGQIQTKKGGFSGTYPLLQQAVDLYQRCLDLMSNQEQGKLEQQLSLELAQLIELMTFDNQRTPLKTIQQKLLSGIKQDELLEYCLVILRAVLKEVSEEHDLAQHFVSQLQENFTSIQSAVSESVQSSQSLQQKRQATQTSMREQLSKMQQELHAESDIQSLQKQAQAYINKLNSSLTAQEKVDQQEQANLAKLLTTMQTQLTHMANQASTFQAQLQQHALTSQIDSLTQIANREAYSNRMALEYERWKRYKKPLSLVVVDIDFFKKINDQFGHSAGDKTLHAVAQCLQKEIRATDFVARWGGEEFVMLFPQTTIEALKPHLENIRQQVASIPFKFKNQQVSITISQGAAEFQAGDSPETVFERADSALYEAKNSGRNRCHYH